MKNDQMDYKTKAYEILSLAFSKVPFVKMDKIDDSPEPYVFRQKKYFIFGAIISGKPFKFIVYLKNIKQYKNSPNPIKKDIDIDIIKKVKKNIAPEAYPIIISSFLSDESIKIFEGAGVGCADLSGNIFFSFESIFVSNICRYIGSERPSSTPGSIYSAKASRGLRKILMNPFKKGGYFVKDIANIDGLKISTGLASIIKQELLSEDLIEVYKKSFFIKDPEKILETWSEKYSYKNNKVHYFDIPGSLLTPSLIQGYKDWHDDNRYAFTPTRYALTLFSGASMILGTEYGYKNEEGNEVIFFYLDGDISELAEEFGLVKVTRPKVGKATLVVLEPYDEGVFLDSREIKDKNGESITVVSPIQLYLDLNSHKDGKEIAKKLFNERIKPEWEGTILKIR